MNEIGIGNRNGAIDISGKEGLMCVAYASHNISVRGKLGTGRIIAAAEPESAMRKDNQRIRLIIRDCIRIPEFDCYFPAGSFIRERICAAGVSPGNLCRQHVIDA